MKKISAFLVILFISLVAFGQTNSPIVNNFISQYQKLENKYKENYKAKDYKQGEPALVEIINLANSIKLPDNEMDKYQPTINWVKSSSYYNLACSYSLLNQKRQAVKAFEKAIELGYSEYQHSKIDTDLNNIRKDKKFISLLNKIKQYDKLYILQKSGSYKQENTDSLPIFNYLSVENKNLKNVRKYFNLDSIAGKGDEITRIINLMFFVNKNIKYDGSNWALCEFDAIDLYNYYKTTGKGINCRHKAMVLNEMYLAMGFKSRYVTCMPKDPNDPDCHVINSVYSETMKKWLWMDASHGIYVTDENNNLLSISEVRDRLKNGKPLKLNKEATQTKAWYLDYYMAKNLYWLQCPTVFRFNTESRYRDDDLQYISLVPVGYGEGNPYLKGNVITHNPDYFWQIPKK